MKIKQLLSSISELDNFTITSRFLRKENQIINAVSMLDRSVPPYSPYKLYLSSCYPEPQHSEALPDNIAIIFPTLTPQMKQLPTSRNVIYIASPVSVSESCDLFAAIIEESRDFDSDCQALTEAFFSDLGIQSLTNEATTIFGNPFWVIDVNFNFLSKPSRDFVDDPYIIQEIELGYVSNRNVEDLKERKIFEQIQRTGKPYRYSVHADPAKQIIAAPVRIKSITVGYLQLFNSQKPYGPRDSELLEHLAKLVSLELQKSSFFSDNKGIMYSYFLNDLLSRRMSNIETIRTRLKTLGLTLGKAFQVLVIDINTGNITESSIQSIAAQIQFSLINSIYVIQKNRIVFLINLFQEKAIDEDSLAELKRCLFLNNLNAGLSDLFFDILECAEYFQLACKAAELGKKITGAALLHQYRDITLFHLVELCGNSIPSSVLGRGCLEKLVEYDKLHDTDFYQTLYTYLNCMQSIPRTAAQMGIHVNTLRYRIEKIKELIEIHFEEGTHATELLLAYHQKFLRDNIGKNLSG